MPTSSLFLRPFRTHPSDVDANAKWLLKTAQDEVRKALDELPAELGAQAGAVTVIYEPTPGQHLLEEGWEEDLLGMFSGYARHEASEAQPPMPPQILLFYENLWDFAGGEEETYREEVRITYLHELGHYLGLDEAELDERGLL